MHTLSGHAPRLLLDPADRLRQGTACLTESILSYLLNRDLTLTKNVTIRYEIPDASMCQTFSLVVTQ
jgi:hypothetical protein